MPVIAEPLTICGTPGAGIRCSDCLRFIAAVPSKSPYAVMLLKLLPALHLDNCYYAKRSPASVPVKAFKRSG